MRVLVSSLHILSDLLHRYCNEVFISTPQPSSPTATSTNSADNETSIYHVLLSLYLSPPQPNQPNWPPALDLLSKHGARLSASTTLELVPATLPVRDLESYFLGRIRAANSLMNEERIVAKLRGVQKVAINAQMLLGDGKVGRNGKVVPGGLNRRVVVDEDRHCGVCHKRFGGSAIRVWPDGAVVHQGCMRGTVGRTKSSGVGAAGWR